MAGGGVAAEPHEAVLVVLAAQQEGHLDGARPLGGALQNDVKLGALGVKV